MVVRILILLLLGIAPFPTGNSGRVYPTTASGTHEGSRPKQEKLTVEKERDDIFMLLAYAIARKGWQDKERKDLRGHNIAAILVSPENKIVQWARNCNIITSDPTQHAEVRAIQQYLRKTKAGYLHKYTIYSTLEPCAMCAGMMLFTRVGRCIYGQTDPQFGKAIERLSLDSGALKKGYSAYPFQMIVKASDYSIYYDLDAVYATSRHRRINDLVGWLRTSEAKKLLDQATSAFLKYKPQHKANLKILMSAQEYYKEVPDKYGNSSE